MTHPRAADDFAAIRARVEELQRERDQISARKRRANLEGLGVGPLTRRGSQDKRRLLPQLLQAIARAETT